MRNGRRAPSIRCSRRTSTPCTISGKTIASAMMATTKTQAGTNVNVRATSDK